MRYICQTMKKFEELAKTMDIVLFGSGEYCLRFISHIGDTADRVKYILDNAPHKWGGGTMWNTN